MVQDLEGVAAPRNADELLGAFGAFMAKAAELEKSHALLQAKVRELTGELAVKVREVEGLKNHLASVLENVADAVVAVDPAGRVTSANRAAAELFGRAEPELRGRAVEEAGELAAPLAAMVRAALAGAAPGGSQERTVRRADGSAAVLLLSVAPLCDERRRVAGLVASAQDVTALRELERAVERKERLAALGEMAAVLAHEIRNPLGGIQLYAGLLGRSGTLPDDEREVVEKISRGIAGLNKLVEDMLAFAREIVARRVRQDVRLPVEGALEMAAAELDAKQALVEKSGWDRPLMAAVDGGLLTRAFLNLFINAAEAVELGGKVSISGRFEEAAGVRLLVLKVADNGRGLRPAEHDKVFNPFYTTKARGTGLGLAVVNRIISAHGGSCCAENVPGGGAVFTVRLPVSEEA